MLNKGLIHLTKVQAYLQKANDGAPGMSAEVIEEAGEALKKVLHRTFNETRKTDFKLRMSNIGQPACKLTMERDKAPKETQPYSFRMKMLIGDMVEIAARAIIKSSGIKIDATNQFVKLPIGPLAIPGSYDDKIEGEIWDIKSSSNWAYKNKWLAGFDKLEAFDDFGYCAQIFGYAEADNAKAGGFFVVNKETGEWCTVSVNDTPELRKKHLARIEANVLKVADPFRPFTREYQDEPEVFRKVPTGNRVLGFNCSMCDFKFSCWPGLKHRTAVKSEAANPPMEYYTVLNPDSLKTSEERKAIQEKQAERKAKKNATLELAKDLV